MPQWNVSTELAAKHGLPGLLGLNPDRDHVLVELDLPRKADRIDETVVPGVEALAFGFMHKRLAAKSGKQEGQVAVTSDYILVRVRKSDLNHFLVSLAAILAGSKLLHPPISGRG